MANKLLNALVALSLCLLGVACGGKPDITATTTQVAAEIFATQAAYTLTPTLTSTPTPTFTPTFTLTPTPTQTPTDTPTPTPTDVVISLSADGSGDFDSLEQAILAAPPGATVKLGAGKFVLDKALLVTQSIRWVGAGASETELVSSVEGAVVSFQGAGPFIVEDIGFRHDGSKPAHVVIVRGGEIAFTRCQFSGSMRKGQEDRYGLWLALDVKGTVSESTFVKNYLAVGATHQSQVTLEKNTFTENTWGIYYAHDARGSALNNEISGTKNAGIVVTDKAQPALEGNRLRDNKTAGIIFSRHAGGKASKNEITGSKTGILVQDEAQPELEENLCKENQVGIQYSGQSGGSARKNECTANQIGIQVEKTANPELVENNCHDNTREDIVDKRA